MDLTPLISTTRQMITGYGNGGFKVNQQFTAGSLIVLPERSMVWDVAKAEDIDMQKLLSACMADSEGRVELLLIGTGMRMIPPPAAHILACKTAGIAMEAMDTGAACRTYNVLMSEDRRVAAALIAV